MVRQTSILLQFMHYHSREDGDLVSKGINFRRMNPTARFEMHWVLNILTVLP